MQTPGFESHPGRASGTLDPFPRLEVASDWRAAGKRSGLTALERELDGGRVFSGGLASCWALRFIAESSGPPTPGALVAEANRGSAQAVLQQKRIQTVMNQSDGNQIKMTAIKTSLPLPLPRIYCLRFSFLLLFATLRPYQKQALLLTGSPSGVTISLNPM